MKRYDHWIFLRHFEKSSDRPPVLFPLWLLAKSKLLLNLQLCVNRASDRRIGLSKKGKEQARKFAAPFCAFLLENGIEIERICSSPYRRTIETAAFAAALAPRANVTIDERIRELEPGIRFGRTFDDIVRTFPAYKEAISRQGFLWAAPPGAESHAFRRDKDAAPFLDELKQTKGDALFVTHAGFIECVYNVIYGTADEDVVKKFSEGKSARPGSTLIVRYDRETGSIEPFAHDRLFA